MKNFLLASALIAGLILTGCGDDNDDAKKDLEHDSVAISALENKIVTYDNNGANHSYEYCPNGKLYYGNDLKTQGTYAINGNNIEITEASNLTYETDGKFEKGKEYKVTPNGHKEEVTKIVDTVCENI